MASDLPPEQRAAYATIIDDILKDADLESISANAIRKGLQERVDYDLAPQKAAIKALIIQRFDKVEREREEAANGTSNNIAREPAPTVNGTSHVKHESVSTVNGDSNHIKHEPATSTNGNGHLPGQVAKKRKADSDIEMSEMSEVEDAPAVKKVKKSSVKPETDSDEAFAAKLQAQFNAQARSTRGGGVVKKKGPVKKEKKTKKKSAAKIGVDDDSDVERAEDDEEKEPKGGFHKLLNLSEPLAALLGETALSRPQTVKKIWAYVKERDLQNPSDKRQIRCDDAMRAVFKQDQVHMFTMNKILATHLYPIDD